MAPQLCQNHPLRAGAQIAVEKVIVVRSEEWILGELWFARVNEDWRSRAVAIH
jgi:hypothetical protein